MYILLTKRASRPLGKANIVVATAMYLLCFVVCLKLLQITENELIILQHIILDFQRLINGFISHNVSPGGPSAYFNMTTETFYTVNIVIDAAQVCIGDGFLVCQLVCIPTCFHSDC